MSELSPVEEAWKERVPDTKQRAHLRWGLEHQTFRAGFSAGDKHGQREMLEVVLEIIEKLKHHTSVTVPTDMFDWNEIPDGPMIPPTVDADILFYDTLKDKLEAEVKDA